MMRNLLWNTLSVVLAATVCAAEPVSDRELEKQVETLVAARTVTVVHFWAPWCSNCEAELGPQGWSKFVADNPKVKIVFINIWHRDLAPAPKLQAAGLGGQANFIALNHPNPATATDKRLERFLDLPVSWIPATWVYRDGNLRYALNYGEVRFALLQQMVNDAAKEW